MTKLWLRPAGVSASAPLKLTARLPLARYPNVTLPTWKEVKLPLIKKEWAPSRPRLVDIFLTDGFQLEGRRRFSAPVRVPSGCPTVIVCSSTVTSNPASKRALSNKNAVRVFFFFISFSSLPDVTMGIIHINAGCESVGKRWEGVLDHAAKDCCQNQREAIVAECVSDSELLQSFVVFIFYDFLFFLKQVLYSYRLLTLFEWFFIIIILKRLFFNLIFINTFENRTHTYIHTAHTSTCIFSHLQYSYKQGRTLSQHI